MLTPPASAARIELEAITAIGALLIAEEYTALAPIVMNGSTGPRVRVYTVHGEDAVEALEAEVALSAWPCENDDWKVSLPCAQHDLRQIEKAVAGREHFSVRDLEDGFSMDDRNPSVTETIPRPIINLLEMERS